MTRRNTRIIRELPLNAIKITLEGSITIETSLKDQEPILQVTDIGINIKKELKDLIFNNSRQIQNEILEKPHGTSLGLSIC